MSDDEKGESISFECTDKPEQHAAATRPDLVLEELKKGMEESGRTEFTSEEVGAALKELGLGCPGPSAPAVGSP